MNIDQRLHHAARELREIHVAAPPLPAKSAGHPLLSKIPAVAASFLMVLGGVAVWSGLSTVPTTESDAGISSAVEVVTAPNLGQSVAAAVQAMGPREEIALIASLGDGAPFLQPPSGVV